MGLADNETIDEWEARLNVTASSVLPWDSGTPVESHIYSEGINL